MGIVVGATAAASANSAPSLPARTAAQLLAEVAQASARPLGPLTATVQESSNLGLPSLPTTGNGSAGPLDTLAGGQETVSIWYLNQQHVRIAVATPMQESDARLDGRTLWLWNSKTQTATRVVLPNNGNVAIGRQLRLRARGAVGTSVPGTPLAAARQLLSLVGPTTVVGVQRNVTVAGRPAYQLSLAPKSNSSLIGRVLIAIDASRHIPLRLEVIPRGPSSPAYEIGFTALTFGPPAASNFTFTPPPGAKVKKVTASGGLPAGLGLGALLHGDFVGGPIGSTGSAAVLPSIPAGPATRSLRAIIRRTRLNALPKAQRLRVLKILRARVVALPHSSKSKTVVWPASPIPARLPAGVGAPTVLGTGWLSVLATSPNRSVAAMVQQLLTGTGVATPSASSGAQISSGTTSPSGNAVFVGTPVTGAVPIGPDLGVLRALLKAMTPVHGSWGSGRLLRTSLLSVLVTSNGRILAGAVTPAVLYADAALPAK